MSVGELLFYLVAPPPVSPSLHLAAHHHHQLPPVQLLLLGAVVHDVLVPGVAAAIDHWASADPAHSRPAEACGCHRGRQRPPTHSHHQ